ncbi:lipopolysaccharide heptosyltransferase family protein [Candidatus Pseudothioglobus singularis]|nr:lipopolysaccharide heptosyltransferase family protein [Candidatus Pseudothioglobus singularis]
MKKIKKIKAYLLKLLTNKQKNLFDIKKSKSILILKYDRIGDMVVSTPIFRELKIAYPNISISVLASKANKDVIKNNPYIDKIYTNYKNSVFKDLPTLLKLRKKKFDACIELEHSVIPHAIFRLKIIKPKKIISIHKDGRYGVKGSELKLYDYFTEKDKVSHFGKIWLDTLLFFEVKPRSSSYDFFLGNIESDKAKSFADSLGKKIKIGINTEGSFPEKSIQKKELEKICVGLHNNVNNIIIVILTSPEKLLEKKKMISKWGLDYVVTSYSTETIIDVAALIDQLDLIITPDTSIVHIASSFDKPVVSIHENNEESFRLWSPSSTLSKTVFAKSNYGLFDYSVDKIIKYSLGFIKEIGE